MLSHLHNPIIDSLYCEEDHFNPDSTPGNEFCYDYSWEDEEIVNLLSKEQNQNQLSFNSDGSLSRNEAIDWILKVIANYGFTAMTAVLAVNYFDRFISNPSFQREKSWMGQLLAVACVSIAAKVEETRVPLLVDLQDEGSKYVFEAKTIQRMEILVLSTLGWKMNPVTSLSFLDHIGRRFELFKKPCWRFLERCESIILAILPDCRIANYLPSVIAAATMRRVIRDIDPHGALEWENRFLSALRINKETIDDCYKCVVEILDYRTHRTFGAKRKHDMIPGSPSGVIDAYFNSDDSSNESWPVAPSTEPCVKRSRASGSNGSICDLADFYSHSS